MKHENQKDIIIAVLETSHYSPKIIEYLNKKKIYNSNGDPYSCASIQKIVSGTQKNIIVELEIVKLLDEVKKIKETKDKEFKKHGKRRLQKRD